MKILTLLFLFYPVVCFFGQSSLISNQNTFVTVKNNSYLVVKGGVELKNNASFNNKGIISLTSNWENNSGNSGFTTPSNGLVILNGDNQQIKGLSETTFNKLVLENGIKTTEINVKISDSLAILDSELQTLTNSVSLENPSPNALTWGNSFISSDLGGYFIRSTNSLSTYSFPVGAKNLENVLRAVEITPTSTSLSSFGVRMANVDPNNDVGLSSASSLAPFDTESLADGLDQVNKQFYHNIYRFSGTAEANSSIYFFNSDQDNLIYKSLAKWNSDSQEWLDNDYTISNVQSLLPNYNIPNKIASSNNVLTYEDDVYSLLGIELLFPTSFSPNNDGFNDFFEIEYLDLYPENELTIFNRWGQKVYYAKPYLNDWKGINVDKGTKLLGKVLPEDTYFYILTLDDAVPPIKNYVELVID